MKSKTDLRKALFLGFASFVVTVAVASFLQPLLVFSAWRHAVILLPIFPIIYIGLTIALAISQMDEMQRRIHLEALAFSMANTCLITFFLGLMQLEINLTWVLPIAAAFWGLGLWVANRRYE